MKKLNNYLRFILLAALLVVGCGKNEGDEKIEETLPNLSLSADGLSVKMSGTDLERTFVVTSDIAAPKDILITVTTNAASAEATLSSPNLVLKQGETTTSGKIKFLADAFPIGSGAKEIKVSIASEGGVVDPAKQDVKYSVMGADKPLVLPNATLTCDITEVLVAGKDVNVPVTIKLDAPAEQYTEFRLIYGSENTITTGSWTSVSPIYIDEGEQEVTFNVVFAGKTFVKGVTGVTHLKLTSDGAKIDASQSIRLNVSGVDPNMATLSTDGLQVVVGETDFSKTLTVTLTENALSDVVFNVAVEGKEGDFELVDKTITIKKGEKTGTGVIKFLKKAFPIELMSSTAAVSITTASSGIVLGDPNKIVLNIKGTGTAPMGTISVDNSTIKVGASDVTATFTVSLSEVLTKTANFTITAASDKEGSYTLNTKSLSIAAGATSATGSVTFKAGSFPYDTDRANIKVSIASTDVIVINSGASIDFSVSGEAISPNKEDVRYHFENNKAQTVYVGESPASVSLFFINEGRTRPSTKVNNIYPKVTGGVEGVDYTFARAVPIVIQPSTNPYGYVYLDILPAAAGKKLTVELFSDEATIGTNKTVDLDVVFVVWPPVTRSEPKLANGTDNNNYGICVPKVKVNATEYTTVYPRKEWVDLSGSQSFNVTKGANTIEISSYAYTDDYYTTRTYMLIYADFNNDGDFSDPGEEIAAVKMDGMGKGAANSKQFTATMTVPADAAAEFPIRIGAAVITGTLGDIFTKGYFINPGDASMLRMSDYKAVVK